MSEESKRQRKSQGSTIAEIRVWNTYVYGSFSFQLVNKVGLSETKKTCLCLTNSTISKSFLPHIQGIESRPIELAAIPSHHESIRSYALPGPVGPVVGSSSPTGHKSNTSQNWFWQNFLKKVLPPCWWGCRVDCRPSWWHVVRLSLIRRQSFTKVHPVARLIPYQLLPIMWWPRNRCKFDISHLYDANSVRWTDLISLNKTKPSVLRKYDYPLWSLTHLHPYNFWMNQALL